MAVSSIASAAADTQLLAVNTARNGVIVTNTDANDLYVLFDSSAASSTNYSVKLAQDETFGITGYGGEVRGIWSVDGAGAALVTDW